jgi:hypothetical protein
VEAVLPPNVHYSPECVERLSENSSKTPKLIPRAAKS